MELAQGNTRNPFHLHFLTHFNHFVRLHWQMAGLTAFYSGRNYYLLAISRADDGTRCLLLFKRNVGAEDQLLAEDGILLPERGEIRLAFRLQGPRLQFFYSTESEGDLLPVGEEQDATILSDEILGSFTGAFAGLAALDLSGKRKPADFRYCTCRIGSSEDGVWKRSRT